MKKSIVAWFDPYSIEHLEAYTHLTKKGCFPEGMNLEFPLGWQVLMMSKLAQAWIDSRMGKQA